MWATCAHYRMTLELKCQDLDAEQLARRSVPPSTMSLLGLIRHLAKVEATPGTGGPPGPGRATAVPHRGRPRPGLQRRGGRSSGGRGRLGELAPRGRGRRSLAGHRLLRPAGQVDRTTSSRCATWWSTVRGVRPALRPRRPAARCIDGRPVSEHQWGARRCAGSPTTATLEMKCDGPRRRAARARRSVPPSTMSLLGLVRHLAQVENHWFHRVLRGVRPRPSCFEAGRRLGAPRSTSAVGRPRRRRGSVHDLARRSSPRPTRVAGRSRDRGSAGQVPTHDDTVASDPRRAGARDRGVRPPLRPRRPAPRVHRRAHRAVSRRRAGAVESANRDRRTDGRLGLRPGHARRGRHRARRVVPAPRWARPPATPAARGADRARGRRRRRAAYPRGAHRRVADLQAAARDTDDAWLRLHLLSDRLVAPHTIKMDGVFGLLTNVVWTSAGPVRRRGLRGHPGAAARRPASRHRVRRRQVPADDRLRAARPACASPTPTGSASAPTSPRARP